MIELISFLLQEIPASKGHFSKLRQALFTLLFTFLPPFEASSTSECLILLFSPFLIAFGRRKLTFCVDETFNSMKNAFVPFFLVTFRRKSSFFGRSIGSKNGRVNSLPGLPDRSKNLVTAIKVIRLGRLPAFVLKKTTERAFIDLRLFCADWTFLG